MYFLNLLYFGTLFFIPTLVFSSSTGGSSYNMTQVTLRINEIDDLLDTNEKNYALAEFLKDDFIWKNSEGKFNKNDPGIANVLAKVREVLCEGPEPCMIEYKNSTYVPGYIRAEYASYQFLSNFVTALKDYQDHESKPPDQFVLETYMNHIYNVMKTYQALFPLSWVIEKDKGIVRYISMDELRKRLSTACLELLKGNLMPVFQDSLKKALGISIPNKDGDGNKGGNSKPLPLGMKIALFGALPLVSLIIIGIVVYRLKFK